MVRLGQYGFECQSLLLDRGESRPGVFFLAIEYFRIKQRIIYSDRAVSVGVNPHPMTQMSRNHQYNCCVCTETYYTEPH